MENWKSLQGIVENGDSYEISSLGALRNINTGKLLKQVINQNGYVYYHLFLNGDFLSYEAHRLVALAFIPNPDNKPVVNHIKGEDKLNNSVDNLEWATVSENVQHAYRTGLTEGPQKPKLTKEDVIEIKKLLLNNEAQYVIAEKFGVTRQCISNIQRGKTWSHVVIEDFTPFSNSRPARNRKITAEDVVEIKKLAEDGITRKELAERYGVSTRNISHIVNGKSWADVS